MLDWLIAGGRILDGTGSPWFHGNLGIEGGRISFVSPSRPPREGDGWADGLPAARAVLDARGLAVSPGFVDAHCHTEVQLLARPGNEERVRQGITTEILGQDGISYAPVTAGNRAFWRDYLAGLYGIPPEPWDWQSVGEFLARLDGRTATNMAYLVPHGNVRCEVMGASLRAPDAEDLRRMRALVERGLEEGAVGLSTGLAYEPAIRADTEELVELCAPLRDRGGTFVIHLRDYGASVAEAAREAFTVGARAGVPVHVSHYNGRAHVVLPLMDRARADGVEATFDVYPYRAGCTILVSMLPPWIQEGGVEAALRRLAQPSTRQLVRGVFEEKAAAPGAGSAWDPYVIAGVTLPGNRRFEGLSLPAAAAAAGKGLGDFVADLLREERLAVTIVAHQTARSEEDLHEALRHPCCLFGSDAVLVGGKPHPRGYGAFPRLLGVYARERRVLPLEECVRKMTSMPARQARARDRGLLTEGFAADVAVFDPGRVADRATYEDGRAPPEGIEAVFVNGALAFDGRDETPTFPCRTAGRALRAR